MINSRYIQRLAEKTRVVATRLDACYGFHRWQSDREPLDVLVATILSQNTSDTNSSRAFAELKKRFPTWPEVIEAPTEEVAAAIQSGGLANVKAPRIQEALRAAATTYPEEDFDVLRRLPMSDARAALMELPGVGPKTAS